MGVIAIIVLIIGFISYFISRAVYVRQVRNNYKTPMLTASLIFLLSFAVMAGGVLFLLVSTLDFSRH